MEKSVKGQKKLATRIALFMVCGLLIAFAVLTVIIAKTTSDSMTAKQEEELLLLSEKNAQTVHDIMQNMVNKQQVLIDAINSTQAIPQQSRIDYMSAIIGETKKEATEALDLFYVIGATEQIPNGLSIYSTGGTTKTEFDMTAILSAEAYKALAEAKNMLLLDPHGKTINGVDQFVVTILMPVLDGQGNVVGAVGSDVATDTLNNADYSTGGYSSFANLIVCGHETVIVNTLEPATVGEKFIDATRSLEPEKTLNVAKEEKEVVFLDHFKDGTSQYKACTPFYVGTSQMVWMSVSSVSQADFMAPVYGQLTLVIIVCVIALVMLTLLCYIVLKKALRPLREIEAAAEKISAGNLEAKIAHTGNDEVGSLAESMRQSVMTLAGYIKEIERVMKEMAAGNFDISLVQPFLGDFKNVEQALERFIVSISNTLEQINTTADQVSDAAGQVANGAQSLAAGSTEQATAVERLSKEIGRISESVKHNAENAKMANEVSLETMASMTRSNENMGQLMTAMDEIHVKSGEINKIIQAIEDITRQTNILSLNAAVEAARAGEAGKGFAVVADEVRNLAARSAEAAKETTKLIEASVTAIEKSVDLTKITAGELAQVVRGAQAATEAVADISEATDLEADAIAEAMRKLDNISEVVQMNSATSQESAASSEELSSQASLLKELISNFKLRNTSAWRRGKHEEDPAKITFSDEEESEN